MHRPRLRRFVDDTGQVRYGGIRRSSASPRLPCDGTPSASVWPSPRQTPGPPCPNPSDRTPPDATMKPVGAPSAWSSPSDIGKKASDGQNPPQGVAPHTCRGVVGADDMHERNRSHSFRHVQPLSIYLPAPRENYFKILNLQPKNFECQNLERNWFHKGTKCSPMIEA